MCGGLGIQLSGVEYLSCMCKVLGSVPSTPKKNVGQLVVQRYRDLQEKKDARQKINCQHRKFSWQVIVSRPSKGSGSDLYKGVTNLQWLQCPYNKDTILKRKISILNDKGAALKNFESNFFQKHQQQLRIFFIWGVYIHGQTKICSVI